jgi:hypothetical protein
VSNGSQPGKEQRVGKENRPQPNCHLDEHVASVRSKHSLAHAAADGTAKSALLRLLEHNGQSEQKAHNHF